MAGSPLTPYRLNPNVLAQRMGEELILLNLQTNRFYELNSTAARFWELLSAGSDQAQACRLLFEEFEVEADRLAMEIDELVRSLIAENFLLCVNEPGVHLDPEPTPGPSNAAAT